MEGERVAGVLTLTGIRFRARAVVLTVGTFLGGRIHVGLEQSPGGARGMRRPTAWRHACGSCRCGWRA